MAAAKNPRGPTGHEEMERRIRHVLEYIRLWGWHAGASEKIAEQLEISVRSVDRLRQLAEARVQSQQASEITAADRADFRRRLLAHQQAAAEREDGRTVASLLALEARVAGFEQAPEIRDPVQVVISTAAAAPPEED